MKFWPKDVSIRDPKSPKPYKTLVKREFLGRKEPESGPGDKLPNSALPNIEQAPQNQPEM